MIKISVIVPSYGRPEKLERTINSIINQSIAKNIELIIVDDNEPASDNRKQTSLLISNIDTSQLGNFIYVKNAKNSERSFSRNQGFKSSRGEFIAFLDNDDFVHPLKYEKQIEAMCAQQDYVGVSYSSYNRVSNGQIVKKCGEILSGRQLVNTLGRNIFIHPGSNLVVRRSVMDDIGLFNESISYNEDLEFLARIFTKYEILYVDYLGLTVDVSPTGLYSNEPDYISMATTYREVTSNIFNDLNEDEKVKVLKLIGLQLIFQVLKSKKINKIFSIKRDYKLKISEIIEYFAFIKKRNRSGLSYGFQSKK